MRRHSGVPLAVLTAALLFPSGLALASCGAEDCPLDAHAAHAGQRFSFDLSYQTVDQDQIRIGSRSGTIGELPSPEDEVRTLSRTILMFGHTQVGDRLGLTASLPYVDRIHEHIANEEGTPPELREWHFSGLGDLSLLGQYVAWKSRGEPEASISIHLGAKLPTGRRHVESMAGEEPEPPARPGTGSLDALAGVHLMRSFQPRWSREPVAVPLFLGLQGRWNGRGTEDYRIGNELQVNAGGSYPVGHSVQVLGQLNARFRGKDSPGETDALRDNTGGTWIFAAPGLRFQVSPLLSAYGYVQFPVWERVNRIQLVAPYHLSVAMSYALRR